MTLVSLQMEQLRQDNAALQSIFGVVQGLTPVDKGTPFTDFESRPGWRGREGGRQSAGLFHANNRP